MRLILMVMLVMVSASWAVAQEMPSLPSGCMPEIMLARATEKDGTVVVRFLLPVAKCIAETQEREVVINGKKQMVESVIMKCIGYQFEKLDVLVDGKVVTAYGADGMVIDPKLLSKRLGKGAQVAVMAHDPGATPKLDPYYLRVLREDIVIFTGPREMFCPPSAQGGPVPAPVAEPSVATKAAS